MLSVEDVLQRPGLRRRRDSSQNYDNFHGDVVFEDDRDDDNDGDDDTRNLVKKPPSKGTKGNFQL